MLARLRKTIFGPVPTQTLVDAGVLPVNVPMLRRQLEVACQVKLPLSKGADLEGICSFLGTLLDVLEQPDGSALVIDRSEHNDAALS